jgi:hypothetical protein
MKALSLLSLLVLSSCVSGRVVTNVTAYGTSDLERAVVFIADEKASIHQIELMKRCAKGVASVGVQVLSKDCDTCLKVNLKTDKTANQVQSANGLSTGFAYGSPNFIFTNSASSGTVTVITKTAEVTISKKGKEVHGMTLVSKSRDESLLSAISAMCAAGFKNFPKTLEGEPVVTRINN